MEKQLSLPTAKKPNTEPKAPSDNTRPIILAGLLIILLFFGGLGVWAATATISAAVIAQGEVKVDSNRRTVQHLEGGIVREILVRDGDRVSRGQVLIRLEAEQVSATFDLQQGQRDHLLAVKARLEAERDRAARVSWPSELLERRNEFNVAAIMEGEEKIFQARRSALQSQTSLLQTQIEQLQVLISSLQEQAVAVERIIASLTEEIESKTILMEGRYLERSHIMELARALDGHRARQEQLIGERAQTRERIAELRLRIQDLNTQYMQEAVTRLGEVQNSLFELEDRRRPTIDQARRLEITAPDDGIVVGLKVHTPGGVIAPRDPLMDIVPGDMPLIVEAQVDVHRISDLHVGQQAELVLTAFKQRTTPRAQGTLTYISADRLTTQTPHGNFPYFETRIAIDRDSLIAAINDPALLTPGMPVEVYIKTHPRTVLQYLMEPVTAGLRKALREQ
ncbi:HlyD family type I secretion periplasmic adaptor subunit [Desulfonatronum thioautotrophicum]|uniref:HlyD family type I secretion periplasmic adaptor subunit n=1 Tax=Desulfonatronum thioautotrophicum TaxID=617001 RepID=UPI000699705D|nr:HlyD family type I secretion periplasmic adaptor subunit [Desulfonatronum thioautotrophicum]